MTFVVFFVGKEKHLMFLLDVVVILSIPHVDFLRIKVVFPNLFNIREAPTIEIRKQCLMYILTSVWVLCTPNTGQNILFQCLLCKKAEKKKKKQDI